MDETISRSEVLAFIEDMEKSVNGKGLITDVVMATIKCVKDFLTHMPSAQSEPQWIPCSKTIDIPDHEVLCCDRHGEELIGWLSYNDDQWLCESDGEMMYDPIAWREKPESYKEEGEDDAAK